MVCPKRNESHDGFLHVASRRTSDEGSTKHKAKLLVASKNREEKKTELNLYKKISKTEGELPDVKKITAEKEKGSCHRRMNHPPTEKCIDRINEKK